MGSAATGLSDPFRAPSATGRIGSVEARERVVLTGIVVRVEATRWVGGPVLEAELRDVTGSIGLAFLGRRSVGGVEPGALVTAAGTVGQRSGRAVVLNPLVWLLGRAEGARERSTDGVDIPAVPGHRDDASVSRG